MIDEEYEKYWTGELEYVKEKKEEQIITDTNYLDTQENYTSFTQIDKKREKKYRRNQKQIRKNNGEGNKFIFIVLNLGMYLLIAYAVYNNIETSDDELINAYMTGYNTETTKVFNVSDKYKTKKLGEIQYNFIIEENGIRYTARVDEYMYDKYEIGNTIDMYVEEGKTHIISIPDDQLVFIYTYGG